MVDRPRRPSEHLVDWAIDTGRINPANRKQWTDHLAAARGEERRGLFALVEGMAPALAPSAAAPQGTPRQVQRPPKPPTHLPGAARLASHLGLDLGAVTATGLHGEITLRDVHAAARSLPLRRQQVAAAADAPLPTPWAGDPAFAPNPLIDQLLGEPGGEQAFRDAYAANPKVPSLFASGDLPPFTASGIEPETLQQVPWWHRHAVAQATTREQALAIVEQVSTPEGAEMASQFSGDSNITGAAGYRAEIETWLLGGAQLAASQQQNAAKVRDQQIAAAVTATEVDNTADDDYEALFGEIERGKAERRAERERSIAEGRSVGNGLKVCRPKGTEGDQS